jgi:hypothetical protein
VILLQQWSITKDPFHPSYAMCSFDCCYLEGWGVELDRGIQLCRESTHNMHVSDLKKAQLPMHGGTLHEDFSIPGRHDSHWS